MNNEPIVLSGVFTTNEDVRDFSEWNATFVPVREANGDLRILDTWDAATAEAEPNHLWAVVEGDDEDVFVILPGYHLVNVMYFLATVNPWTEGHAVEFIW